MLHASLHFPKPLNSGDDYDYDNDNERPPCNSNLVIEIGIAIAIEIESANLGRHNPPFHTTSHSAHSLLPTKNQEPRTAVRSGAPQTLQPPRKRTNIELPTSNVEQRITPQLSDCSTFDVQRSKLDVRISISFNHSMPRTVDHEHVNRVLDQPHWRQSNRLEGIEPVVFTNCQPAHLVKFHPLVAL